MIAIDQIKKAQILFFDGECHLCNGVVDFLISRDTKRTLFFASLQGKTAMQLLSAKDREELQTVIFYKNEQIFRHSDAVLQVFAALGGVYAWLGIFKIIPSFVRDSLYRLVARNRYRLFGKREFCRIPTPEEKDYLLP